MRPHITSRASQPMGFHRASTARITRARERHYVVGAMIKFFTALRVHGLRLRGSALTGLSRGGSRKSKGGGVEVPYCPAVTPPPFCDLLPGKLGGGGSVTMWTCAFSSQLSPSSYAFATVIDEALLCGRRVEHL